VGVQSIWTAVQEGNIAGDHLLVPAGKVAFGKMNGVGELHYLTEKVWPLSEALEDAGHFCAAGGIPPLIICSGGVAGGVGVLDLLDLQATGNFLNVVRHQQLFFLAHDVSFPRPM